MLAIGAAASMAIAGVISIAGLVSIAGPGNAAGAVAASHGESGTVHWTPVPFRDAQLSVPGSWVVESRGQQWCPASHSDGMIFAGTRPQLPRQLACSLSASVAWIVPAGHIPAGVRHSKSTTVINGIPVYAQPSTLGSVVYLVPDLGVRVGARGPKARRVLATLTRSPLSVVLKRGAPGKVPSGWTWRRFGDVRFATPPSWALQHANQWATCGTGLMPRTLLLIDATKPAAELPCPYPIPVASAEQARAGLTVVTGRYAAGSVRESYRRCRVRNDSRICLSSVTGQGGLYSGVLIFSAAKPDRRARTYFVLGLGGSGSRARAVFDSIRVTAG